MMALAFWCEFWCVLLSAEPEPHPSATVTNLAQWRREHPRRGAA
jgi:hypothetical protein